MPLAPLAKSNVDNVSFTLKVAGEQVVMMAQLVRPDNEGFKT